MAKADLTVERLRERLDYDPETGLFRWATRGRRTRIGAIAGKVHVSGYIVIGVDGRQYPAHRLAWMHVHGAAPADCIDHVNGDQSDNKIANLRDVSRRVNNQNLRTAKANNRLGLLGVFQYRGKFRSYIRVEGRRLYLGAFDSAEDASAAYLQAKRDRHEGCTI